METIRNTLRQLILLAPARSLCVVLIAIALAWLPDLISLYVAPEQPVLLIFLPTRFFKAVLSVIHAFARTLVAVIITRLCLSTYIRTQIDRNQSVSITMNFFWTAAYFAPAALLEIIQTYLLPERGATLVGAGSETVSAFSVLIALLSVVFIGNYTSVCAVERGGITKILIVSFVQLTGRRGLFLMVYLSLLLVWVLPPIFVPLELILKYFVVGNIESVKFVLTIASFLHATTFTLWIIFCATFWKTVNCQFGSGDALDVVDVFD